MQESEPNVTITLQRLMTPEYASPEQVKGERITTLSDVYSLGVFLYELLTGTRPYKLKTRSPDEIARAICEQEPDRPSTAIGKSGTAHSKIQIPNSKLLRGDLDNIVLKALRKEPERRYASVDQFSGDIRRYLEGKPVRARKDTVPYRAGKFVTRHKIGMAAAVLVLLITLGGMGAYTMEARRTAFQAQRAAAHFRDLRKLANLFVFKYHDAIAALPGSTELRKQLVKDALDYLNGLAGAEPDDPALLRELATAYQKVGQVQGNSYYANLGDTDGAMKSYQKSLQIRERLLKDDPNNRDLQSETADSHEGVGDMFYTIGNLRAGLSSYERSLALWRQIVALVPNNTTAAMALASVLEKIGDIKGMEGYANLGDIAGAREAYQQSIALLEPAYAREPGNQELKALLANVLTHAGVVARTTGDLSQALSMQRKAVEMMAELAAANPNHPTYQIELRAAQNFLLHALEDNNDFPAAAEICRRHIVDLEKMRSADPNNSNFTRNLGVTYNSLGKNLLPSGDLAGALENHRKALAIAQELSANDPNSDQTKSDVAFTLQRIGNVLAAKGDYRGALENYRKALQLREPNLAADPGNSRLREDVSSLSADIGNALVAIGDFPGAFDAFNKAVSLAEQLSAAAPSNTRARVRLARQYHDLGKAQMLFAQSGRTRGKDAWQQARDSFARSLSIFQELRDKGALLPADAKKPDKVSRDLATCADALKNL